MPFLYMLFCPDVPQVRHKTRNHFASMVETPNVISSSTSNMHLHQFPSACKYRHVVLDGRAADLVPVEARVMLVDVDGVDDVSSHVPGAASR